jgi:uncharacterized ParB-like nuclease family protein
VESKKAWGGRNKQSADHAGGLRLPLLGLSALSIGPQPQPASLRCETCQKRTPHTQFEVREDVKGRLRSFQPACHPGSGPSPWLVLRHATECYLLYRLLFRDVRVPDVSICSASAGSVSQSHRGRRLVLWIGLGHYGVEAVVKPESFPIDKIYVPVKRRKALKSEVVQEIAESILEIGQQAPILVRPDEDRFVLIEGHHRLEACRALGEKTIIGLLVSAEVAHQKVLLPHSDEAEAEHRKMERLRRLRLEKEAAEKLADASRAVMATESAVLPRERPEKHIRNSLKGTPSRLDGRTSGSTPMTLSEWRTKQERNGGRY